MTQAQPRRVRSFVRREGRMTAAQRAALDTLWPRFGVAPQGLLDPDTLFGRCAARTLEIGFGNGEHLAALAAAAPEADFLGIEVHRPGVGSLLNACERLGLGNLRLLCMDAVECLEQHLPDASLDRIFILFPDPWPKKRHHKRRLIQPATAALLARKLAPGGRIELATDWKDYAQHMRAVLDASADLENLAGPAGFMPRATRNATRFERRGARLGHSVFDLAYRRVLPA
jgi:tRNA (guanine-N7-)-methyltransferase